jgi:hypothetical protein
VLRLNNEAATQYSILALIRDDIIQVLWSQEFNCTKGNSLEVILKELGFKKN